MFFKVLVIFTTTKKICSEIFHKKKHTHKKRFQLQNSRIFTKKNVLGSKIPIFRSKSWNFHTQKNAGRFATGFSHKKHTKKKGASRRFFTKKNIICFLCVKIFVKKTLTQTSLYRCDCLLPSFGHSLEVNQPVLGFFEFLEFLKF